MSIRSTFPKGLSALDPGKQGLKLDTEFLFGAGHRLSALDPGKQGLKRDVKWCAIEDGTPFSA